MTLILPVCLGSVEFSCGSSKFLCARAGVPRSLKRSQKHTRGAQCCVIRIQGPEIEVPAGALFVASLNFLFLLPLKLIP